MTLTIELKDEQMRRLEAAAEKASSTPAALAEAAVTDLLDRQEKFARIKQRVLTKNHELLERLA